jgi:hypothetical protein
MKPGLKKKAIWDRIWYPDEKDFIRFKVFQMISIPLIMVFILIVNIFLESRIWTFLMLAWLLVAVALGAVASIRFKMINPPKGQKNL